VVVVAEVVAPVVVAPVVVAPVVVAPVVVAGVVVAGVVVAGVVVAGVITDATVETGTDAVPRPAPFPAVFGPYGLLVVFGAVILTDVPLNSTVFPALARAARVGLSVRI
jgi:hypothetical protein